MARYRVYVTGTLDYDYEVEAADQWEAEAEAEALFQNEFPIMWSGVDTYEVEELEADES